MQLRAQQGEIRFWLAVSNGDDPGASLSSLTACHEMLVFKTDSTRGKVRIASIHAELYPRAVVVRF